MHGSSPRRIRALDFKINTGHRPLPPDAMVYVEFRSRLTAKGRVRDFRWQIQRRKDDVIKWREIA